MPKILWLPASEISHMEELGWKWKYGNKCPRNTPLSRLLCAIQSGLRKKCSSSKEAKVDRLIILYQKSTSHTLFSLLDKIIFNFFWRCKTFLQISGLSVRRVVDWNGWRKTLKKVHMHLQSNIPHFLGLSRCAMSRKWICFNFKFNLKWEADILSQSDDGVGTQNWASPEPISQLLNTPTCNIHTRTILIDILTSKRSVGTPRQTPNGPVRHQMWSP